MKNFIFSKLLFLLLFIPLVVLEATVEYNLTKILPPPGYDGCQVVGINENGFVIGQLTSSHHPKMKHAFIWSEGEGMRIIKPSWWQNLIQNQQIIVTDINDKNEIVGYLYIESLTCEWYPQAFIWDENQEIRLLDIYPNTPYSMANAINNKSQIVGVYKLPAWISSEDRICGFIWSEEWGLRDLSSFDSLWSEPNQQPVLNLIPKGINNEGYIIGYDLQRTVIFDEKSIQIISSGGILQAWNSRKRIIYNSYSVRNSGLYGNNGVHFNLTNALSFDINDNDVVVGCGYDKGLKYAFIFDQPFTYQSTNETKNLNSLIMCSDIDSFSSANAINNKGQIAGDADYIGMKIGFLITPKKKI
ncbi:MAG: DUF3466 family protein [Chlamydiales bacterium]